MFASTSLELQVMRMLAMAPTLIVMLVGVILAIRRLPAYPRSCWAILAALAFSGFNMLGVPVLMTTFLQMTGGFNSTSDLQLRTFILTLPHSLIAAVSWGLILFAVFDRPSPPKFLVEDDLDRDTLDK